MEIDIDYLKYMIKSEVEAILKQHAPHSLRPRRKLVLNENTKKLYDYIASRGGGEISVADMIKHCGLSHQAVSRHLAKLLEGEVITRYRGAKRTQSYIYTVTGAQK